MKKTQSLKLMLLGLMALVSTGAWAQYAVEKGVVYHVVNGKALVAGVIESKLPTEFDGTAIRTVGQIGGVDVTGFESGWKTARTLENTPTGNAEVSVDPTETVNPDGSVTISWSVNGTVNKTQDVYRTADATAIEGVVLILDGAELKEISRYDIDGLKIAKFILAGESGITEIPENLFAPTQVIEQENQAKADAIKAANDKINGYTDYFIKDGKLADGQQTYVVDLVNSGAAPSVNPRYIILGTRTREEANGKFSHPAYLSVIPNPNDDKYPGFLTDIHYWVWEDGDNLMSMINGVSRRVAHKFTGNGLPYEVIGSKDALDNAKKIEGNETDKNGKWKEWDDARKAVTAAQYALDNMDATNEANANNPENKKALRLKAAIEAFKADEYWEMMSGKLHHTYTNVENISPWFAAWALANISAEDLLANSNINRSYWEEKINEFVEAYNDFYGKDAEVLDGVTVTGYNLTQYTVAGELIEYGSYDGDAAVEFTDESGLLVKDGQNDLDAENEDAYWEDFYRITVLTGNEQGKNYYIKADPSEINPEESKYYALYEYDEGDFDLVQESGYVTVVKFNGTQEYGLIPTGENAPTMDAADPEDDYLAVIKKYAAKDEQALKDDLTTAQKKMDKAWDEYQKAHDATVAAQTQYDLDDDALKAANLLDDYVYEYRYDVDGTPNETLVLGAFNNDIVAVGAHAFTNCVNAEFTGTFRSNLQKIGAQAFMNTQFKNLDLSATGKKDWRGGELDEDGNPTPDGKIDIQDRLTSQVGGVAGDIAVDAFVGTPMEQMLLATTNFGDGAIRTIVSGIKHETVNYTIDCVNEDRFVNQTLTTVTLPAGEGEGEDLEFDWIQNGTFQNCVELTAISIPAQVYSIEVNAFRGCFKLGTIKFAAVNSELRRIAGYAFYETAAEALNLTKQTLLGTNETYPPYNVVGGILDYAFAKMENLKVVNLTNTQLTTLPSHVFEGDALLNRVTFYDAKDPKSESTITSLPAGIFKTNVIKNLDLGKTQITELENLFQASPEKENIYDCDGNKIGEKGLWNETLQTIILPEELEEIDDFALSSLWGLTYSKANPFIIPSSVKEIGVGAFMNDKNLVAVKAMDSELTALPQSAFAQCSSLEEVTLVTVNTLMPGFFGDKCFFATKDPDVYVNNDTYKLLGENFFEGSYAILKPYASVINTNKIGSLYYKPWTSKYGAWIEATEHVGVYTAYQNGSKISLYPAKKSTFVIDGKRKDYYKIAAYDKDAYEDSRMISDYGAPYQIDYLLNARMTFDRKAQYGEGLPDDLPTDGASYIDSYYYYLFNEEFDADELEEIFSDNFSKEVRAKTWLALGTAIIVSDQADAIPYLQKTNPWQKYQSTLDLANQLIVATEDIPADNNTNFYYLAEQDGKPKFIHHNDETVLEFIPEEAVAFMMDADFGHMGMSRDFFDIEFISENGATAINGVVERSINDGEAIYNLQGVKVAAPKKGQLYIQGGKTFIQK